MDTEFYSIRIFRRGQIEIFKNVFRHNIYLSVGIEIVWSSTMNTGNCTHSMRSLEGVYNIAIVAKDDMRYRPLPEDENVKIIIN